MVNLVVDSKAARAAKQFLNADETLVGAFNGMTGPRPGVEAAFAMPLGFVGLLASNVIVAWIIVMAVVAGVSLRRRHVLVAVTSEGVVQVESGLRRVPRPGAPVGRFRMRPNFMFAEAGDPYVTVFSRKMWVVRGADQDEARRLARLAPKHSA